MVEYLDEENDGDTAHDLLLKPSHFKEIEYGNNNKCYNKWMNCLIAVVVLSLLSLLIGGTVWSLRSKSVETMIPSLDESDICFKEIKQSIQNEADIAYYFEEGIRHLPGNKTMSCIVLSRFKIFSNTTSILTHSDTFCFDEGDEFGSNEPALIANDNYLISCFNLIDQKNDFCVFAQFNDENNGKGLKINQEINMILDINNNDSLFGDEVFSCRNLKSFVFFGDELFGIDVKTKQHFNHWNLSDHDFSHKQISFDVLSTDLHFEDLIYPIRLEAHNGFLYLFQRFESVKGVEVSKISYFDQTMGETGLAWSYSSGHENLFEDFDKIHGFVFDPNMKKYFMFSDIEIILNDAEESADDDADFFIDSDFKFKLNAEGDWKSSYHVKIPIITAAHHEQKNYFNLSEPMVLHLDYTHNFVYFPIKDDLNHDTLYFMQFVKITKKNQIIAKLHKINPKRRPFMQLMDETLQTMDGMSVLQVVAGQDIAIQRAVVNQAYNISNEQSLDETVEKYGYHQWAEAFYQILQSETK